MPDLNSVGHAVMGGSGPISVQRGLNDPPVVIADRGTVPMWLTDTDIIAQVADIGWKVARRTVIDGHPQGDWVVLDQRGCNFLAAKGGYWQAALTGEHGSTVACFGSYGELAPHCNLGQIGTDGRGSAAPDGTINIPVVPNTLRLLHPSGNVTDVPGITARDVQVIRSGQAIWRDDAGTIGCVGIMAPAQPGPIGRPRYVETDFGTHIVAWKDGVGLVVWHAPDPSVGRIITSGVAHAHEAVWYQGRLIVRYSLGIGELTHELAGHDDVFSLPLVDLAAPVEPIVPIGRKMWLGWHTGTPTSSGGWMTNIYPTSVPGNAYASILGAPEPHAVIYDFAANPIAVYTEGEVEGDITSIEARIADARAKHPGLPVMIYWPQAAWHTVPSAEWCGVEAYWGKDESKEAFVSRVLGAVEKAKQAGRLTVPIFHCFTSNTGLQQDLTKIPPLASQLARDHLNIDYLWVFNGTGRGTGLQDHPEVRPLWEQVFAGITGPPSGGGGGGVEPPGFSNGVLVDPETYWREVIVKGEDVANYIDVYARKASLWYDAKQGYQNRSNCTHSSRMFMTHAGCRDVSPNLNDPTEACLGVKQVPEAWECTVDTVENWPGTTTPKAWLWHNPRGPAYMPPEAEEPQPGGPVGVIVHDFTKVVYRSSQDGLVIHAEGLSERPLKKYRRCLLDQDPPVVHELDIKVKQSSDGRWFRVLGMKTTGIDGTFMGWVEFEDDLGNIGHADFGPVKVTSEQPLARFASSADLPMPFDE